MINKKYQREKMVIYVTNNFDYDIHLKIELLWICYRDNDRQYQKQLRIQRSTKQNAGVYMDTTMLQNLVSPREVKGPTAYASLSDRNKDLYEIDSEDEI